MTIKLAVVGVGKICRDQHLPAIAANDDYDLIAAVSRNATVDGVENFADFDRFLADGPDCVVSLCTPPKGRTQMALKAIAAGRDLMIEKPPAATLSEIETLIQAAENAGVTLFATWHSRYAPCVQPAKAWLEGKAIKSVHINWKEDVRRWHPGQDWIWEPGGFGVFDPGINALSILTELVPDVHLDSADLIYPENRAQPIAATLAMPSGDASVTAELDWRQEGPQSWDIDIDTDQGKLSLSDGGATMKIDGLAQDCGPEAEYPELYRRFAELVTTRRSDVDIAPLRLVADAFLLGRRETTEAFHDDKR